MDGQWKKSKQIFKIQHGQIDNITRSFSIKINTKIINALDSHNMSYNYKKKKYAKKKAPSKMISRNCKLFLVDHIGH